MRNRVPLLIGLLMSAHVACVDAQSSPLEEAKANKAIEIQTGHRGTIYSLVFSPDGKELATSSGRGDPKVKFWDYKTGKLIRSLEAHEPGTWAVAYTPDSTRLVTTTANGKEDIRVWDSIKHTRLHELQGHRHGALTLAVSAEGKQLVSVGKYKTPDDVVCWDLNSGKQLQRNDTLARSVQKLFFLPDKRTLLVNEYDRIRLWRIGETVDAGIQELGDMQKTIGERESDHRELRMIAISRDGHVVAVAAKNVTQLWETVSGKEICQIATAVQGFGIAFSPDGRTIARSAEKGTIRLFDWPTETEILSLKGHSQNAYKLAFSGDGNYLASVGAHPEAQIVRVWDISKAVKRPLLKRIVTEKEMASWLKDLANSNAKAAYEAVWKLVEVPHETVPQLKKMIEKRKWLTRAEINRLIAELNDEAFSTRQNASKRLISAGTDVIEPVKNALKRDIAPDQRQRLEQVIEAVKDSPISTDYLVELRAAMVLERIGSSEAWKLLQDWARAVPESQSNSPVRDACEREAIRRTLRNSK